jgi:acetyltransferase-like isoleucine patch superfamily enzyme
MLDLGRAAKSARNRLRVARSRARGAVLRWAYAPIWTCGPGLSAGGGVDIEIYGTLSLGQGVTLSPGCALAVAPGATLRIGDGVFVGRNTVIVASRSIDIGDRTLIAEHCTVRDGDHHVDAEARRTEASHVSAPIAIGADCWIGAGARILRGAGLGDGVVVGAGAVVRAPFGPRLVVAGTPARVVKPIGEGAPRAAAVPLAVATTSGAAPRDGDG